jgi:hypothetical protein
MTLVTINITFGYVQDLENNQDRNVLEDLRLAICKVLLNAMRSTSIHAQLADWIGSLQERWDKAISKGRKDRACFKFRHRIEEMHQMGETLNELYYGLDCLLAVLDKMEFDGTVEQYIFYTTAMAVVHDFDILQWATCSRNLPSDLERIQIKWKKLEAANFALNEFKFG